MNFFHQRALKAAEQMSVVGPFECCYFNGTEATYAINRSIEGVPFNFNDVIWFRTVDLVTGQIVREGSDQQIFWGNGAHELRHFIEQRYTADHIRTEALQQAAEQFNCMKAGSGHLHTHVVFGDAVYFADVEEFWVRNDDGKITLVVSDRGFSEYDPATGREIVRADIVKVAVAA